MQTGPIASPHSDDSRNITAVVVDYGKVLARSATREQFAPMAEMFDVSFEDFYTIWEATRDPYDCGDVTPEDYWLNIAERTKTRIDQKQIEKLREIEVEIWQNFDQGMLVWVGQLQSAGFKTGLLSNMPCDLVARLRSNCRWMNDFVFKTFSCEVRTIKPEPAIYEHTLKGLGVSAAQALFVDDREVNVNAARALGMQAIQFQSIGQLKDDLERLGFPVTPEVSLDAPDQSQADARFSALL